MWIVWIQQHTTPIFTHRIYRTAHRTFGKGQNVRARVLCSELKEISDASCLWILDTIVIDVAVCTHEYWMMIDGTYNIITDSRSNCINVMDVMDIEWTNAMSSTANSRPMPLQCYISII